MKKKLSFLLLSLFSSVCAFSQYSFDLNGDVLTIGNGNIWEPNIDIKGVKTIYIKKEVERLNYNLFQDYTGVTEIILENGENDLQMLYNTTAGNDYFSTVPFYDCSIKKLHIGRHILHPAAYDNPFNVNELETLTIGGVENVSLPPMTNAYKLKEVIFEEGAKPTSFTTKCFYNCRLLTKITIPGSVTTIGTDCFIGCTSLKELIIEDSGKTLNINYSKTGTIGVNGENGRQAFYSCPLEKIYIGRNLKYSTKEHHQYSPFYNIKSIREVEFSTSVTSLEDYLLYECTGLLYTKVNTVIPISEGIYENTFKNAAPYSILYVPVGSEDEYQRAYGWRDFYSVKGIATITCSSTGKGVVSINNAASEKVEAGNDIFITVIPDAGYQIGNVTVNGIPAEIKNGGIAYKGVDKNLDVKATFVDIASTATVGTIAHGSLQIESFEKSSVTIKTTPDEGYELDKVYVNGVESSFTQKSSDKIEVSNVPSNAVLTVTYKKIEEGVTIEAKDGGEVNLVGYSQGNAVIEIKPEDGYEIGLIMVNSVPYLEAVAYPNGYYYLPSVAEGSKISVAFTKSKPTIVDEAKYDHMKTKKIIENGKIIIIKGNKKYDIIGKELK